MQTGVITTPSWRIHTKYAVLMGIDRKIAKVVNKAIDFKAGIHDAGLKSPIESLIPGISPRYVPRLLTYSPEHGIILLIRTLGVRRFFLDESYQYAVALHYLLDEVDSIVKRFGSKVLQNIDYDTKEQIIIGALNKLSGKLYRPCDQSLLGGYIEINPCNEVVGSAISIVMDRAYKIVQNNLNLLIMAVDEIIKENGNKGFEVGPEIILSLLKCVCRHVKRRGGTCLFTVNGAILPMASAAVRIANIARKGTVMISGPIVLTASNTRELIQALQKYCDEQEAQQG